MTIQEQFDKHRKDTLITCRSDCWCWDVESLLAALAEKDRQNAALKSYPGMIERRDTSINNLLNQVAMQSKVIEDMCETDANVRELFRPLMDVDGDSHGVPGVEDLAERCVAKIAALKRNYEAKLDIECDSRINLGKQITALRAERDKGFELAITESAPDYERVPRLYSLVHHLQAEIEELKLEMNRMVRY